VHPARRGFLNGIALLLTAVLSRSGSPGTAGGAAVPPPRAYDPLWAALRQCWLELVHAQEGPQASLAGPTAGAAGGSR
jgi:hypothetical protein